MLHQSVSFKRNAHPTLQEMVCNQLTNDPQIEEIIMKCHKQVFCNPGDF